jgi:hypothetical protein
MPGKHAEASNLVFHNIEVIAASLGHENSD